MVLHAIENMGRLAEHLFLLGGLRVSDSARSQRRAVLPLGLFERILAAALRPRATLKAHPQAFYAGLRLVGIDGTEFLASHTPGSAAQEVAVLVRAQSRLFEARLEAAAKSGWAEPLGISFAKLRHYLDGIVDAAALAPAAGTPLSGEQLAGLWQGLVKQLF